MRRKLKRVVRWPVRSTSRVACWNFVLILIRPTTTRILAKTKPLSSIAHRADGRLSVVGCSWTKETSMYITLAHSKIGLKAAEQSRSKADMRRTLRHGVDSGTGGA